MIDYAQQLTLFGTVDAIPRHAADRGRPVVGGFIVLNADAVIDVPPDVAVYPYCESALCCQADEWEQQDDGSWAAGHLSVDCVTEPDLDDVDLDEYDAWVKWHTDMPYVYWLPVNEKVLKWVNERYRFELGK